VKAVRVAVFLNPANGPRNTNLQLVQEAARVIGLQIHILNASTSGEIDAAPPRSTGRPPSAAPAPAAVAREPPPV